MSATLECDLFSSYFYDAPVYGIQGRTFPVEVRFALCNRFFCGDFYLKLNFRFLCREQILLQLFYGNTIDTKNDDYVFIALSTLMQIHQKEPTRYMVLLSVSFLFIYFFFFWGGGREG